MIPGIFFGETDRKVQQVQKKRQARIKLSTRSYFYVGKNVMWLFQVQINDFFIYPWAYIWSTAQACHFKGMKFITI